MFNLLIPDTVAIIYLLLMTMEIDTRSNDLAVYELVQAADEYAKAKKGDLTRECKSADGLTFIEQLVFDLEIKKIEIVNEPNSIEIKYIIKPHHCVKGNVLGELNTTRHSRRTTTRNNESKQTIFEITSKKIQGDNQNEPPKPPGGAIEDDVVDDVVAVSAGMLFTDK